MLEQPPPDRGGPAVAPWVFALGLLLAVALYITLT